MMQLSPEGTGRTGRTADADNARDRAMSRYTIEPDKTSSDRYSVVDNDYRAYGKATKFVAHKLTMQHARSMVAWGGARDSGDTTLAYPAWVKARIAAGNTFND